MPSITRYTIINTTYKAERLTPTIPQILPAFKFLKDASVYFPGLASYSFFPFADKTIAMIPQVKPTIP